MRKQDQILVAAVRLGRFTVQQLVEESGQHSNTVYSWLRLGMRDGLAAFSATVVPAGRGRPQKIFEVRPKARQEALRNAETYEELARAQYTKGEQHGFVEPPLLDVEELLGPSERALRESIWAFRRAISAGGFRPLLDPQERARVVADWSQSCAGATDDKYAATHAIRQGLFDSTHRFSLLVEEWGRVGVTPPRALVSRFKAIYATATDPRTFVIAAAFDDIAEAAEQSIGRRNRCVDAGVVKQLAALFAEEALAEASTIVSENFVAGSNELGRSFDLTKARMVPALRFFYALDWAARFDQIELRSLLEGNLPASQWQRASWGLLGLVCSQAADDVVASSHIPQAERTRRNLARASLSATTQHCGWGRAAAAICELPNAFITSLYDGGMGDISFERRQLLWVVARVVFGLCGEMRCMDRTSSANPEEALLLEGAVNRLLGSGIWPQFADPLFALLNLARSERVGESINVNHLERCVTPSKINALTMEAELSNEMKKQLTLVRERIVPTKAARTSIRQLEELPSDQLDAIVSLVEGSEALH